MDREEMRAMQYREENGYLPDERYVITEEDDPFDPEQAEIRNMVIEQYAYTNARRTTERLQRENAALRLILEENGIDVEEGP